MSEWCARQLAIASRSAASMQMSEYIYHRCIASCKQSVATYIAASLAAYIATLLVACRKGSPYHTRTPVPLGLMSECPKFIIMIILFSSAARQSLISRRSTVEQSTRAHQAAPERVLPDGLSHVPFARATRSGTLSSARLCLRAHLREPSKGPLGAPCRKHLLVRAARACQAHWAGCARATRHSFEYSSSTRLG